MSKGGDPFNFNDLYAQMGAENLVKRPMANIKKQAPAPSDAAKPQAPPSPVQATAKPYDVDFLDFGGMPKAAAATSTPRLRPGTANGGVGPSTGTGTNNSLGFDELFPTAPANTTALASRTADDPFAAFESVDGAMPVVKSTPISLAATPNASTTNLVSLTGGTTTGAADVQLQPATMSVSPMAAAPLPPEPTPDAAAPPMTAGHKLSSHPQPPSANFRSSTAALPNSQQLAQGTAGVYTHTASQAPRTSFDGGYSSHQDQPATRPDSSVSQSHTTHDKNARGVTGFFSDLGKKAVKAAQVGLQHLGNALESKEPGAGGSSWAPGNFTATNSEDVQAARPTAPYEAVAAEAEPDETAAAKALEVAVRIAELPMEVRSDALAQLKPDVRTTVEEILREQVLLETEDRDDVGQRHQFESTAPGTDFAANETRAHNVVEVADLLAADVDLTSRRAGTAPENMAPSSAHGMDDFFSGTATRPPGSTGHGQEARSGAAAAAWNAAPTAGHQLFGDLESESGAQDSGAGHVQPTMPPPHAADSGLDIFTSPGQPCAAAAPPMPQPQQAEGDLGDFFRGGQSSTSSAVPDSKPKTAMQHKDMDLIDDLHSEGVDVSSHQQLYQDVDSQEGEPEIRRQLRAARLAERNGKMRAALAEKLAQDEEEARRKEEQVQLKDQHKQVIDAWKSKHKANIRGLLGSLHTVLWESSGWTPVSVGDMLESNQVKKVYMKANLLVHPDKVRQRNGTAEQVAVADMVFDVLKEAWNAFKP